MNRDAIFQAIEQALDEHTETYQAILQQTATMPVDLELGLLDWELSKSVSDVLAQEETFSDNTVFSINLDNGNTRFSCEEAAIGLIHQPRTRGSQAACNWLEKVITTQQARGLCVMVLWGVTINVPVILSRGVELIPINQLPESKQKERVLGHKEIQIPISFTAFEDAEAALLYRPIIEPFLTNLRDFQEKGLEESLRSQNLLNDTCLALTVVGPSAPVAVAYWFQFEDEDLDAAVNGHAISSPHLEIAPPMFLNKVFLDPLTASSAVEGFFKLPRNVQARVRIALQRLNQAVRRVSVGDKAIELAIALESLLVDGVGENTHKVCLRAALLIGGSLDERLYNRSIVGAIYKLRSELLHKGDVKSNVQVFGRKERMPSSEVVKQGLLVTARVVQQILKRESIPDWYGFELNCDASSD